MHESSLVSGLVSRLEAIGREHAGIVAVKVRLGALSQISPAHFREHFERALQGTAAARARIDVEASDDLRDPWAQEVVLESVEVEG